MQWCWCVCVNITLAITYKWVIIFDKGRSQDYVYASLIDQSLLVYLLFW